MVFILFFDLFLMRGEPKARLNNETSEIEKFIFPFPSGVAWKAQSAYSCQQY